MLLIFKSTESGLMTNIITPTSVLIRVLKSSLCCMYKRFMCFLYLKKSRFDTNNTIFPIEKQICHKQFKLSSSVSNMIHDRKIYVDSGKYAFIEEAFAIRVIPAFLEAQTVDENPIHKLRSTSLFYNLADEGATSEYM